MGHNIKNLNQQKLKTDLTICGFVFLLLIALALFGQTWFCPFYDGIGIPSPGCGFTSALKAVARGDLKQAYWHHPLVFLTPLLLIYYSYSNYFRKKLPKHYHKVLVAIIIIFIIVYILRIFGLIDSSALLYYRDDALVPRFIKGLSEMR